jgi:hypothetical protein
LTPDYQPKPPALTRRIKIVLVVVLVLVLVLESGHAE